MGADQRTATRPGDELVAALLSHPGAAKLRDDVVSRIVNDVVDRFSLTWQSLEEHGPKVIADAVAAQLGHGWPLVGEERRLRHQAERQAERVSEARSAREIEAIAERVVELLDAREQTRGRRPAVRIAPRLLTFKQAGEYLGYSDTTIRQLVADGKLLTSSIGQQGRPRIDVKELDRYVDSLRREGTEG